MRKIVDLHCHYVASQPNAIESFKRLVERPEVVRVSGERGAVAAGVLARVSTPDLL